jgi:hypothetical protein
VEPHAPKFGGGATYTVLHPLVLVAMLLAMVLFFVLPRKYVIVPVLATAFLIPLGQEVYVYGIHLFVYRILILAGFVRAMVSNVPRQKSHYAGGWNSIDTAVFLYVVMSAVGTTVQHPDIGAFINQIGYLWDYLLGYLLLRSLIRDANDTLLVIKCFAGLMVLLGAAMVVEQMKMPNVFGLLGGVNAISEVRDGKIRSQAVFQHPLTAGTFAATAIPLFVILWKNGKGKLLPMVGLVAATVMTVATQTSTCLLTYAASIMAVFMWPLRQKMKIVRTIVVVALVGLHLLMKAPVWFIIARIDLTGSSSNYHRAELIDQFVNHFSSWWLIGTKDAANWGWGMWDVQNMYVSVGEAGGLAALVSFVLVISQSFARVGSARKRATLIKQEWFPWLLGAALFANVVAFFGVNYFDQSKVVWFALISMICACTAPMSNHGPVSKPTKVMVSLQVAHSPYVADETSDADVEAHRSMSRHLWD